MALVSYIGIGGNVNQISLKLNSGAAQFCDHIFEGVKKVIRNEIWWFSEGSGGAKMMFLKGRCCKNQGLALKKIQCLKRYILEAFWKDLGFNVGFKISQNWSWEATKNGCNFWVVRILLRCAGGGRSPDSSAASKAGKRQLLLAKPASVTTISKTSK